MMENETHGDQSSVPTCPVKPTDMRLFSSDLLIPCATDNIGNKNKCLLLHLTKVYGCFTTLLWQQVTGTVYSPKYVSVDSNLVENY